MVSVPDCLEQITAVLQLLGQLENAGPPPASQDAISKLPTITITQEDVDNGKDCTVCMDTFKVNESAKKLPCSHFFHISCIDPWLELHNTCPICRKVVEDKSCDPHSSANNPSMSGNTNSQNSGMRSSNNNDSTDPNNDQSFFSFWSNFMNPRSNNSDPQS